jgi:5'-3' exonuclease
MGINKLLTYLTKNHGDVFTEVHLSNYRGKKISIDTSIYMNKFKAINSDRWLESFVSMVCMLRAENIHPVFVFDNGNPTEKEAEKKKRSDQRAKQRSKIETLAKSVANYEKTKEVDDILREVYEKETGQKERRRSLLLRSYPSFDLSVVRDKLGRMQKNLFVIKPADYEKLKALLGIMKVPWILAADEAEKTCVQLVQTGLAHAVLSEDSDCLAYGVNIFAHKLDFCKKTVLEVNRSTLLAILDMTQNMFTDFCIMCGTDYNPNIKGVGVVNSYSLIAAHKTIDQLPDNIDVTPLKHKIVRRLFTDFPPLPPSKKEKIVWCGKPDRTDMRVFLFKHNMRHLEEQIVQACCESTQKIVFTP